MATFFANLWNDLLRLQVALLLREDTAAVFLNVHLQLPGLFLTCPELRPEITVFGKGVNVGVVPVCGDFKAVPLEDFNALVGTGRAAGMQ